MAGPEAMAASTALQMVGTVMGAVGEADQLKASARADRENARRGELQGELQVLQTIRDERQASGEAIAAMAGSGVAIGTGTAADLIRQNAVEREMEILNIRYSAGQEAANLRASAANKKSAAKSAIVQGVISAVAQGAQGYANISNMNKADAQAQKERDSRLPRKTGGGGSVGSSGPFGSTSYRANRSVGIYSE